MPSPKLPKPKRKAATGAPPVRPDSKLAKSLELMQRPDGVTIEELTKATGWQKHSMRGAIAGAIKKRLRQRVNVLEQGNRRAYVIVKRAAAKKAQ
jgi:Protein of unknown function (DUF3489)